MDLEVSFFLCNDIKIGCNTCYTLFVADVTMYFDYLKDLKYSKIVLGMNDSKMSELLNVS